MVNTDYNRTCRVSIRPTCGCAFEIVCIRLCMLVFTISRVMKMLLATRWVLSVIQCLAIDTNHVCYAQFSSKWTLINTLRKCRI